MPFIRYENGDMASLLKNRCTCGVVSPMMSSVDGRTIDTITLKNGSEVHGVFFTDLLFEIGTKTDMISRFQVYQHKTGAIDFKLESTKKLPGEVLRKIESAAARFFDTVNVIPREHIPSEDSGKFKYIKKET